MDLVEFAKKAQCMKCGKPVDEIQIVRPFNRDLTHYVYKCHGETEVRDITCLDLLKSRETCRFVLIKPAFK